MIPALTRTFSALFLLTSLNSLICPSGLSAQSIHGRVIRAADKSPVRDALVELRNSLGVPVQHALTLESGTYQFMVPAPGRYALRVAAIGFAPTAAVSIDVPAAGLAVDDIALSRLELKLPDIVAISQNQRCGAKRILGDDLFGHVLNSARSALDVIEATISAHDLVFDAITVHSSSTITRLSADTVHQTLTRWPLEAAKMDTTRGPEFGRLGGPGNKQLASFYGPDPGVIFADWFLESHCFALQKTRPGEDALRIAFTPGRKSSNIDVSGELTLDAHTLAVVALAFRAENLPGNIDKKSAGGEIRFEPIRAGLWIPVSWSIWGPIQGSSSCLWQVMGLNEMRGAVIRMRPANGSAGETPTGGMWGQLLPRQSGFDRKVCVPLEPIGGKLIHRQGAGPYLQIVRVHFKAVRAHCKSFREHCKSFREHCSVVQTHCRVVRAYCKSFRDHSMCFRDYCMPFRADSKWFPDHCTSLRDHYTSFPDHRASLRDYCIPFPDYYMSLRDYCIPFRDHYTSLRDYCIPFREHCRSIRARLFQFKTQPPQRFG